MEKVGFFTAVSFKDQPRSPMQSLLELVDSYFYLGGRKAFVISGYTQQGREGVILKKDSPAFLMTALKVISYSTGALPVILLISKVILRSIYTFHLIDAKTSETIQQLEEGIEIPQVAIKKIQELKPIIQGRQQDISITWHTSQNLVFSPTSLPNLIFKMAPRAVTRSGKPFSAQQITEERFSNMLKAKQICQTHQLALLVIPHAKKIHVAGMTLIAEEHLDINPNASAQEHFYKLEGLNETARQLAIFIAKTGFSDVEWRNMPLVDTAPEFQGNRRIALIDLEEMGNAEKGIFGYFHERRGLIRCLGSEEQIDIAITQAQRQGVVSHQDVARIKAKRIEEIKNDQQLQLFYARKGILENPRKLVQVDDLASLGLNLKEQGVMRTGASVTMEKAIKDVLSAINKSISESPEIASLKGKRSIRLDHTSDKKDNFIKEYDNLGLSEIRMSYTDAELDQRWLKRIIDALVAKGYLFKLDEINPYCYCVQG